MGLFCIRGIVDLFLGTFFVSFIMHWANNQIVSVSIYRLCEYFAICGGFFAFANLVKRHNKNLMFGIHLIPKTILLMLIIALGPNVTNYVIPLGLLYGISDAIYCLPINVMMAEKIPKHTMNWFMGLKTTYKHIIKLLAPVILGLFIELSSFPKMAMFILGLVLVEAILIISMSPTKHIDKTKADILGFAHKMIQTPIIRKMFIMEVLRGLGIGLLITIIPMYTVHIFHTNLNLGIFTTIFGACSIITSRMLGKTKQRRTFARLLWLSVLTISWAITMFVGWPSSTTFLCYNFVYATSMLVLEHISNVNMFNLSQSKLIQEQHQTEYFVFRDFAIFIGRWIGFVGLMYIGVFGGYDWLRWYMIPITGAIILFGVTSYQLNNKLGDIQ